MNLTYYWRKRSLIGCSDLGYNGLRKVIVTQHSFTGRLLIENGEILLRDSLTVMEFGVKVIYEKLPLTTLNNYSNLIRPII